MKIKDTIKILEKVYGRPKPSKEMPLLDSLIETILSQNTTDVNRDRAFAKLKAEFPSWDDVLRAPAGKIAKAIRTGGLANTKSRRIKEILKYLKKKHGNLSLDYIREMSTEDAMEELLSFKGVGEKTVKVVLLFSLGRKVFPVDTHIHRLCRRMGFVREGAPRDETHKVMAEIVPEDKMYSFHLNLITHGRIVCKAKKVECDSCPLEKLCPKNM